ncbi:hypothetical protein DCW30_05735 [Streptomyces alfalfae]|uniref:Uncharacterized protein n=1 Tax=Streptomyces alfalfae TaxID=1642299 RepID=A0ABM6GWX1_9ACTN|nr:hypothetical protein [Streptomyces alfalfae]APY88197.1 hypothetical protein A7J05_23135 [Streptomyces alfalfae]AYA18593.1 hypothetical protein D3X13_22250 [Streptomyces fradiae]RXX46526.1 hypothetical protein DCW30_05735 [Streptomyces alfalfae]RZM90039.1 hypothetical protein D4104_25670 [Streptomyces alfalfae]
MTTTANLSTVILHWPDLTEALGARSTPTWPPAGRMSDHLRALDQADAELLEAERHRSLALRILERDPAQLGERPIPIRLPIHETMRIVRALLLDCADAIAESVQRRPIAPPAPRRAAYARTRAERLAWDDHARRVQAAQDDAADPRRWRWTGIRPDAPYTALWLLGRVQGAPGPFRPLSEVDAEHIAGVAHTAAWHVEQALDVGERTAALAIPCPTCGGQVSLHGGAGASPVARCTGCGQVWTYSQEIAA